MQEYSFNSSCTKKSSSQTNSTQISTKKKRKNNKFQKPKKQSKFKNSPPRPQLPATGTVENPLILPLPLAKYSPLLSMFYTSAHNILTPLLPALGEHVSNGTSFSSRQIEHLFLENNIVKHNMDANGIHENVVKFLSRHLAAAIRNAFPAKLVLYLFSLLSAGTDWTHERKNLFVATLLVRGLANMEEPVPPILSDLPLFPLINLNLNNYAASTIINLYRTKKWSLLAVQSWVGILPLPEFTKFSFRLDKRSLLFFLRVCAPNKFNQLITELGVQTLLQP